MIASETKVYRDTYVLVGKIVDLQKNYPKEYKYSIGQKMVNVSLELFEYIQLANMMKQNRILHLNGFIVKFELLKTLVRLSADKKLISIGQQSDVSSKMVSIGKQITAWKNSNM